jgi:hypothetical protein
MEGEVVAVFRVPVPVVAGRVAEVTAEVMVSMGQVELLTLVEAAEEDG